MVNHPLAEVVELVDTQCSGRCAFGRESSSLSFGTIYIFLSIQRLTRTFQHSPAGIPPARLLRFRLFIWC